MELKVGIDIRWRETSNGQGVRQKCSAWNKAVGMTSNRRKSVWVGRRKPVLTICRKEQPVSDTLWHFYHENIM